MEPLRLDALEDGQPPAVAAAPVLTAIAGGAAPVEEGADG